MKKYIINTDGGSRGNPGPAAAGFIICNEQGMVIYEGGVYLGIATNNDAEYMAVKTSLEVLKKEILTADPATVELRSDSQLVVNQLSGRYKIKNPRLKVIIEAIKGIEKEIGYITYVQIPREKNSQADLQVNKILDQRS